MKIAFDIRGLEGARGGKGVWTANVLKSVLNLDREDEFFLYTNQADQSEYTFLPNVHVVEVKGRGLLWHWRLYQTLLKDQIDVFLATESYIVPFLHDPQTLNVGLVVHDLVAFKSPAKHQFKATWVERLTLKKAARKSRWIFAVSESTKKDLVCHYPDLKLDEKITVVYAGARDLFARALDPNAIMSAQRRYGLNPDYMLMAGTLEPRKNIVGALKAFHLLSPKNQQRCELVIAGKKGWYYESIFKAVQSLDLAHSVKFLDYIPDEDLAALMRGARIFLFPSFYEGFGLPVLEAMLCGVPVLSSPLTSIPEVGGEAIHYADPASPVDIADGMTRLLEDEEYRHQLREKGFEQVKRFSWGKTAASLLKVIQPVKPVSFHPEHNELHFLSSRAQRSVAKDPPEPHHE